MDKIISDLKIAITELCDIANVEAGDIVVVGCSTSEVTGGKIGKNSNVEYGEIIFNTINEILTAKGAFLAAQCCEHLNRAIIIEKDAITTEEIVNVVPQIKAGGSFATAAYKGFKNPVAIENIKADAGLDIGLTLIGMHLKNVAVPVRLSVSKIGDAVIAAAKTRPKFIGGVRAVYDDSII
ncbi:MAG: TIGR01440 family protein [Clostridia bacterium]|nr:TIGR01440 family protein [Clostridia bacterium]